MDDKTKLDAYLENLGISDQDAGPKPVMPSVPATPPVAPAIEGAVRLNASSDALVEDFLAGMLMHIDPSLSVSARARNDGISAEIIGGDPGKVIGREGRTLAAIEFLANTVIAKELGHGSPRVSVDAAGYRRRHEERLLEQARRFAARVRKGGEAIELEPMNAADRRIIHIALKEDAFVTTESVGEGRDRRVVIKAR